HFTTVASTQGPPGLQADRVLDEFHRAIAEGDVHATRVVTGRRCRAGRTDEREPGPEIVRVVLAGRGVRRSGVQVLVDDDVPGIACEPVTTAAVGLDRRRGTRHGQTAPHELL